MAQFLKAPSHYLNQSWFIVNWNLNFSKILIKIKKLFQKCIKKCLQNIDNFIGFKLEPKLEQLECLHSEDTPTASWLSILLSHIGSQVKRRQSQSYNFKEFAKITKFWIVKQTLHATHILTLLDKMCQFEMDLMSIVEDTERTRFCPQTDRRTDRRTDKVKPVYPLSTSLKLGV